MTVQQPPAPAAPAAPAAPPSPEATARLQAENEALTAQVTNQALRQAAGSFQGGPSGARAGNVSVIRDATGKVVVTTPDGRTVTVDPAVGLDEDAVQNIVQTALEPPRIPEPPRDRVDAEGIVAIVFTFLFLMTVVIARAIGRRDSAKAAAQAAPADLAARLARIEQAVEAVAIEVERISESERYSARILTERLPERLSAAPNGQGAAAGAPTLDAAR